MTSAPHIEMSLSQRLGGVWSAAPTHASSFSETWRADGDGRSLFLKTLPAGSFEVLGAEADGLQALAESRTIRVPQVIDYWRDDEGCALLALEWLDLQAPDAAFGTRLGLSLGALHRATPVAGNGAFGWRRDNMLGGTPQPNQWSSTQGLIGWLEFLREQRFGALQSRLKACNASVALLEAIDAVIARLPSLFDDGHEPRASLIHGDLWSGNWAMLTDGTPVIYDAAVSCSDAEAELAMMELFGGVPRGFWPAYVAIRPLADGYPRRRRLYQFYHLLNHALLFGGGYVAQSLTVARSLTDSSAGGRETSADTR